MCLDPKLSESKSEFPTFARSVAMYRQLTPSLLALFEAFKWKRAAVFIEKTSLHQESAEFVVKKLKSHNITIPPIFYLPTPSNHDEILHDHNKVVKAVKKAKKIARSKLFPFVSHVLMGGL